MHDSARNDFAFIQGLTAELSSGELIFPTSLTATMKIRRALAQPEIDNATIARLVSAEPVLCAQVLKLANAAAFNPAGRAIAGLSDAILLLGFSTVRHLAIATGMKQLAMHRDLGPFAAPMDGLWTRSLRMAALCLVLARRMRGQPIELALLSGLLHDIGKFYILSRAAHYQTLFVSFSALWTLVDRWHVDIGVAILERWEIPAPVREAVLAHREPQLSLSTKITLTDILKTADRLDALSLENTIVSLAPEDVPLFRRMEIETAEECTALLAQTHQELLQIMRALH